MKNDTISRAAAIDVASGYCHPVNIADELRKLPSAHSETNYTYIIDEFVEFQIEWLTSHCDIEFIPEEEENLIIRFLKDTGDSFKKEKERD